MKATDAKCLPMAHRIMTNGEIFVVETRQHGSEEWTREETLEFIYFSLEHRILAFRSYAKAKKWVHQKYGQRANLCPRDWRPA